MTTTMSSSSSSRQKSIIAVLDLLAPLISLLGLYIFITSFFLAKRSLPHISTCDEAASLLETTLGLTRDEIRHLPLSSGQGGCWMERRVDSMVVVVVDALRFDFALHHLPLSVGARLVAAQQRQQQQQQQQDHHNKNNNINNATSWSQLFQFVADPPTVTMQRLKALTTGGLPTFADISNNMGGASVDEDTWLHQLKRTPPHRRHLTAKSKIGFVGDDTWLDLFSNDILDIAFPYPSFNTRDLDTVDNGCLHHIPGMLQNLRNSHNNNTADSDETQEEVMIVHFLGVDHVGHTYGPHNRHMDQKLRQMDEALASLLDHLDHNMNGSCSVAFIFGDHGMTEDGNHGGGSEEEINAALFAHFSPACQGGLSSPFFFQDTENRAAPPNKLLATSDYAQTVFTSIHQIDLVPTISILLGLPIPYANLGSLVPGLSLLANNASQTATALALNAAQVWRYFTMYSNTANPLPGLDELQERLQQAVTVWKDALNLPHNDHDNNNAEEDEATIDDSTMYIKACSLFKIFLAEALELGQRVWTRFDTTGMTIGGVVLGIGILVCSWPFFMRDTVNRGVQVATTRSRASRGIFPPLPSPTQLWEFLLTMLFVVFSCGVLTFGNSYILEEEHVCMYMIGVLGFVLTIRLLLTSPSTTLQQTGQPSLQITLRRLAPLIIPVASRLGELFVSGHGQDPSVRPGHIAHHAAFFLSSVALLVAGRWYLFQNHVTASVGHMALDCVSLVCLGQSWWEKRHPDTDRHGFAGTRCAIAMTLISLPISIYEAIQNNATGQQFANGSKLTGKNTKYRTTVTGSAITIIIKLLLLTMIVMGPSAASSVVLFSAQMTAIFIISEITGPSTVPSAVLAALWRFIVRHVFFATNHGCTFSRLQLSAAFVATSTFNFHFAGSSLFINTFGWEIVGLSFAWLLSTVDPKSNNESDASTSNRSCLWRWYCLYQLIETLCSCVSVSVLRRHLMVWDIYAPHFLFVAIFMILFATFQLVVYYFGRRHDSRSMFAVK